MTMTPGLRKFALTMHVTSSVGWFGAVASFLALAIAGLASQDAQMVRAAYLAMESISWFVIVPFSLASLLTGLVQSLGTHWGLFRHYWILVKLLLTVLATIILLVHMQPISYMAGVVAETTLSSTDLSRLRIQLLADAAAALFVLLLVTTLSVYKPWGMTAYGRRQLSQPLSPRRLTTMRNKGDSPMTTLPPDSDANDDTGVRSSRSSTTTPWGLYVLLGLIGLILLFGVLHLASGGLGMH